MSYIIITMNIFNPPSDMITELLLLIDDAKIYFNIIQVCKFFYQKSKQIIDKKMIQLSHFRRLLVIQDYLFAPSQFKIIETYILPNGNFHGDYIKYDVDDDTHKQRKLLMLSNIPDNKIEKIGKFVNCSPNGKFTSIHNKPIGNCYNFISYKKPYKKSHKKSHKKIYKKYINDIE